MIHVAIRKSIRYALWLAGASVTAFANAANSPPQPPSPFCVENNCISSTAPPPAPGPRPSGGSIKWHPGHYMMLRSRARNPGNDFPLIDGIGKDPAVNGVLASWLWKSVETSKGVYDFSSIDQYLAHLKSEPDPKRLIIRIEERLFNSKNNPLPDYLLNDPAYNGGTVSMQNGTVARVWEGPVMDRLIALYQALGQRYDSDPYVEGIDGEETSIGFSSSVPAPSSYSPGAQLTQLKRWMVATRAAWPHTNVFENSNYLGSDSQMEDLIRTALANQVVIGGPDTWGQAFIQIGKRMLQSDMIVQGKKGSGTDYRGKLGVKAEIEDTELGGYVGSFLPSDLFDTAYNDNHANFIFWDANTYSGPSTGRWATGILPFIDSINGKSYTGCPSGFTSGCATN